jgi:hypothetical protein
MLDLWVPNGGLLSTLQALADAKGGLLLLLLVCRWLHYCAIQHQQAVTLLLLLLLLLLLSAGSGQHYQLHAGRQHDFSCIPPPGSESAALLSDVLKLIYGMNLLLLLLLLLAGSGQG